MPWLSGGSANRYQAASACERLLRFWQAPAMVDVILSRTGERQSLVFENRDIRAMVKSPHALRISKAGGAGMAVT